MSALLFVFAFGLGAEVALPLVGRMSVELRARAAMRASRARGEAPELAELHRRMFEAQ